MINSSQTVNLRQTSVPVIRLYHSINHTSSTLFPLLRLRQLDIEFMKHLSRVVNVIPVIAKSDTLTLEEKIEFKQRVRMKDGFTG